MIVRSENLPDTLQTDICVVGAGPAGLTLASQFEGGETTIAILEQGPLDPTESRRRLEGDQEGGLPYFPLHESRSTGVGGTSHLWPTEDGLRSRPLDPIDFETRPAVSESGWPYGYDTISKEYARAEHLCRLPTREYDVSAWVSEQRRPLDIGGDEFETKVFKFGSDIGVFRAMATPLSASEKTTVVTGATVLEFVTDDLGSRVDHARVVTEDVRHVKVRAKVFVLAAGGIENARLLLLSRRHHSRGLGNENDLVGRYFQEHLRIQSGVVVQPSPQLTQGMGFYQRHLVDDQKVMGALAPTHDTILGEGLLNTAIYLRQTTELRTSDSYRSLTALKPGNRRKWGVGDDPIVPHALQLGRRPIRSLRTLARVLTGDEGPIAIRTSFQTEQAPNPLSRVTLSSEVDSLGRPRPSLEWRLTDLDLQSCQRVQELLARAFRRAGLGELTGFLGTERPPAPVRGFWHHIGTTRMHASPRHGVVNADCRVHSVSNLFVAGSSVFPTGGFANPTLTVVALALRLATHLRALIGGGVRGADPGPDRPE